MWVLSIVCLMSCELVGMMILVRNELRWYLCVRLEVLLCGGRKCIGMSIV